MNLDRISFSSDKWTPGHPIIRVANLVCFYITSTGLNSLKLQVTQIICSHNGISHNENQRSTAMYHNKKEFQTKDANWKDLIWIESYVAPKFTSWSHSPNVMIFGRLRAVTWGHEGGAPWLKEERLELMFSLSLSAMWEHSRKAATCEPGRQPSPEPDHAGTLISNFQPPEMGENTFRLFRQQKRWHVVMAAQADQDRKNTRAEKLYLASKQKLPDKQEVKQKHDIKRKKKISNWKEDRNEREDGISKDFKTDTVNMLRYLQENKQREK